MGLGAQRPLTTVRARVWFKPRLGVKSFRLCDLCQSVEKERCSGTWKCHPYFTHILEEFLATPAIETPIIEVLFRATDTERAITPGAASKVLASAQFDLAVVNARSLVRNDVPVRFLVEELRPAVRRLPMSVDCFESYLADSRGSPSGHLSVF